jgi:cell division septum initiation protein DivIVA
VTAIAPDSDKLRQLDDDMRRAWTAYNERLRELSGDEYEQAERESWTELQSELRRVERKRRTLNQSSTG